MTIDLFLIRRGIRHLIQKIVRGWSDDETWSLDVSLAKHILPRLKRFKELTISRPIDEDIKSFEDWEKILDEMIYSFEWCLNNKFGTFPDLEERKQIIRGFELFGKYYLDLWW